MVNCSVSGCKSRSERKYDDISFFLRIPPISNSFRSNNIDKSGQVRVRLANEGFRSSRFPKGDNRHKWIAATGLKNWQPTKYSRICSKHFEGTCFRRTAKKLFVKKSAVPALFIHKPVYIQPKQTHNKSKLTNKKTAQINKETEPTQIKPVNIPVVQIKTNKEPTSTKPIRPMILTNTGAKVAIPSLKTPCVTLFQRPSDGLKTTPGLATLPTGERTSHIKSTDTSEKCAVSCCNVTRRTPGYEYYTFPCSADRRQQWLTAIGRPDFQPTDKSFICSKHFLRKWSQYMLYERHLLREVLPSLYLVEDICSPARKRKITHIEPNYGVNSQTVVARGNIDINNDRDESRDPLGDSDTDSEEEFKYESENSEDNEASDVESLVGDNINTSEDNKDSIVIDEENPILDLETQFNIKQCSVVIENNIQLDYAKTDKEENVADSDETDVDMLNQNNEHENFETNITQVFTHRINAPAYVDNAPKSLNYNMQNNPMQETQNNDCLYQVEPRLYGSPKSILNYIRNYVNSLKDKTNFPNMERYEKRLDGSDITYFISKLFARYENLSQTVESQKKRIRTLYCQVRRKNKKIQQLQDVFNTQPTFNSDAPLAINQTTSVTPNEPRKIVQSVKTINNKLGILIESITPNDNRSKKKRNKLDAQNFNYEAEAFEPVIENIYIKKKVTPCTDNEPHIEQIDKESIIPEYNEVHNESIVSKNYEIDNSKPRVLVQNIENIYDESYNDCSTQTDKVASKVVMPKLVLKDRNTKIKDKFKIKTLIPQKLDKESDIAIKNLILSESNTEDKSMNMPVIDDISAHKVVNKPIIVHMPKLVLNDNSTKVINKPKTITLKTERVGKEFTSGAVSESDDATKCSLKDVPFDEEISERKIVTLPTMVVQRVETIPKPPQIIIKTENIIKKPVVVKIPNLVLKRNRTEVDDRTEVQNIKCTSKVNEDNANSVISEEILPDSIPRVNPKIDKRKMLVKSVKIVNNKPVIVLKNVKRIKLDNTTAEKK